ncbi:MAG: nitrite reductase [Firmicutes bacterium HGW-Firmicutes-5]|nr:MAG: nitrite reductase [Firmicutes bacterium HGW-Firmicutes-5]
MENNEKREQSETNSNEKIIIIGNGAAGISAAKAIRKRNQEVKVTILDQEKQVIYYKPLLSEYIAQDEVLKKIYMHKHKWYEDQRIELKLGVTVTKINSEDKTIETAQGETMAYDKLILALGSRSFIPPIKNADYKGVFTLRNIGDADKIKDYAKDCKKAVIIGGGLLGLEAADQLKELGLDITVVELANRLLPRQIDEKGAHIFEDGIVKQGIHLAKGNAVSMIIGHHKSEYVQLMDGRKIPADLVIISAGIVSEGYLAEEAGLEYDRSIIVNKHMQTSDPDIYAAGDVAQFSEKNYGIWPEAMEQGNVAGANAVGDKLTYKDFIPSNTFNGLNMNVFSIGHVNYEEGDDVAILGFEDLVNGIYKKLFFKHQGLIGAVIIGDNSKTKMVLEAMKKKSSPDELLDILTTN